MKNKIILLLLALLLLQCHALAWWQNQTPAGFTTSLESVIASDETTAYAVGANDRFLSTTNRGITWNQGNIGLTGATWYDFVRLSATSMRAVGTLTSQARMYSTSNGGTSWTSEYTPTGIKEYRVIEMYDSTHGFAGGNGMTNNISYYFLQTSSWKDLQYGGSSTYIYGGACPSADVFYACGNFVDPSSNTGLYKSTNSGASWGPLSRGASTTDLYGIYAVSTTDVWVVGNSGTVLHSTDGIAFPSSNTGISPSHNLRSIHFYNATHGYIVGTESIIYGTSDGGATWTAQTNGKITLNSVYAVNANNAWAVGESTDNIYKQGVSPEITSVVNSTNGTTFVQGYSGSAVVTGTNFQDGLTTASINMGAGINISALTFVNSNRLNLTVSVDPAAATGARNITVTNPDTGVGTGTSLFTVTSSTPPITNPTISSISFNSRSSRYVGWSGTTTINGTGFQTGANVLSDVPASISFVVSSVTATQIIGTATLGSASPHRFRVTNPDGGTAEASFTVNPLPRIDSVLPNLITQGATSIFSVSGDFFQSDITFTVSNPSLTLGAGTWHSAQSVTGSLTAAAAAPTGACTIWATNGDGGVGTLEGGFFVNPSVVPTSEIPAVTSVSPTTGTQGATALDVAITGQRFPPNHTVTFSGGGITVSSTTRSSDISLTARINISDTASVGLRTVSVTSNETGATGSLSNAFSVTSTSDATEPTIGSIIDPIIYTLPAASAGTTAFVATSATATSDSFMVNGTNFDEGASVTFSPNVINKLAVTRVSDKQIRVVLSRLSSSYAGTIFNLTVTRASNGRSATRAIALTVNNQSITPVITDDPTSRVFHPNPWKPSSGPVTFQFRATANIAAINIAIYCINGDTLYKSPQPIPVTAGYNKILLDGIANVRGSGHFIPNGLVNVMITNANTGQVLAKAKLVVLD